MPLEATEAAVARLSRVALVVHSRRGNRRALAQHRQRRAQPASRDTRRTRRPPCGRLLRRRRCAPLVDLSTRPISFGAQGVDRTRAARCSLTGRAAEAEAIRATAAAHRHPTGIEGVHAAFAPTAAMLVSAYTVRMPLAPPQTAWRAAPLPRALAVGSDCPRQLRFADCRIDGASLPAPNTAGGLADASWERGCGGAELLQPHEPVAAGVGGAPWEPRGRHSPVKGARGLLRIGAESEAEQESVLARRPLQLQWGEERVSYGRASAWGGEGLGGQRTTRSARVG